MSDSDCDRREVNAVFNITAAMFEVKREKQMVYVFFACVYTLTAYKRVCSFCVNMNVLIRSYSVCVCVCVDPM